MKAYIWRLPGLYCGEPVYRLSLTEPKSKSTYFFGGHGALVCSRQVRKLLDGDLKEGQMVELEVTVKDIWDPA